MVFEWDDRKAAQNIAKHGVPFEYAVRLFLDPHRLDSEDTRRDYGERRVIAVGVADGIPLTVVYTDRAEAGGEVVRRMIPARVSTYREREAYAQAVDEE